MHFSEAASDEGTLKVSDGCGGEVVKTAGASDDDVKAALMSGQPGKWDVRWRIISADDGHVTRGSFSFAVAGKPDCNQSSPNGHHGAAAIGGHRGTPGRSFP